ncbi:MAG: metallophosphoesterase family protein [Promethearchaeota archaeon]
MNIKCNKKIHYFIFLLIFLFSFYNSSISSYCYNNQLNLKLKTKLEYNRNLSSNNGFISNDEYNIIWFIQISDTQFLWYDDKKIADFYKFLNETYRIIKPLFIYNTGDLVDASYGLQQNKQEWLLYKKALEDNNMNSSIYMDIIGNHDAINDPNFTYFLNYSLGGRTFNVTQYSFNKTFSFGKYAFIGLNTAKELYNMFEFSFQGFLSSKEMDWYENELKKYDNFSNIFVFGHHPPNYPPFYRIISEENFNGKDFYKLNREYNVSFYLSGHIHINTFQYYNELLTITTANFDQENGTYRIISLDNNHLSTCLGYLGDWPQALITYPASEQYLFEDLNDIKKIRILAWDPEEIKSVKWSLFNTQGDYQLIHWKSLKRISNNVELWEGYLDFNYRGNLLLKIQVEGNSGTKIMELKYNVKNQISTFSLFIAILMTFGLAAISITITYYLSIQTNKNKKKGRNKP